MPHRQTSPRRPPTTTHRRRLPVAAPVTLGFHIRQPDPPRLRSATLSAVPELLYLTFCVLAKREIRWRDARSRAVRAGWPRLSSTLATATLLPRLEYSSKFCRSIMLSDKPPLLMFLVLAGVGSSVLWEAHKIHVGNTAIRRRPSSAVRVAFQSSSVGSCMKKLDGAHMVLASELQFVALLDVVRLPRCCSALEFFFGVSLCS